MKLHPRSNNHLKNMNLGKIKRRMIYSGNPLERQSSREANPSGEVTRSSKSKHESINSFVYTVKPLLRGHLT